MNRWIEANENSLLVQKMAQEVPTAEAMFTSALSNNVPVHSVQREIVNPRDGVPVDAFHPDNPTVSVFDLPRKGCLRSLTMTVPFVFPTRGVSTNANNVEFWDSFVFLNNAAGNQLTDKHYTLFCTLYDMIYFFLLDKIELRSKSGRVLETLYPIPLFELMSRQEAKKGAAFIGNLFTSYIAGNMFTYSSTGWTTFAETSNIFNHYLGRGPGESTYGATMMLDPLVANIGLPASGHYLMNTATPENTYSSTPPYGAYAGQGIQMNVPLLFSMFDKAGSNLQLEFTEPLEVHVYVKPWRSLQTAAYYAEKGRDNRRYPGSGSWSPYDDASGVMGEGTATTVRLHAAYVEWIEPVHRHLRSSFGSSYLWRDVFKEPELIVTVNSTDVTTSLLRVPVTISTTELVITSVTQRLSCKNFVSGFIVFLSHGGSGTNGSSPSTNPAYPYNARGYRGALRKMPDTVELLSGDTVIWSSSIAGLRAYDNNWYVDGSVEDCWHDGAPSVLHTLMTQRYSTAHYNAIGCASLHGQNKVAFMANRVMPQVLYLRPSAVFAKSLMDGGWNLGTLQAPALRLKWAPGSIVPMQTAGPGSGSNVLLIKEFRSALDSVRLETWCMTKKLVKQDPQTGEILTVLDT